VYVYSHLVVTSKFPMLPSVTQKGVWRFCMSPRIRDIILTIVKDTQSMGEEWRITYVISQFGNKTFFDNALGMLYIYIYIYILLPLTIGTYNMYVTTLQSLRDLDSIISCCESCRLMFIDHVAYFVLNKCEAIRYEQCKWLRLSLEY
jgi:hypothetical protein